MLRHCKSHFKDKAKNMARIWESLSLVKMLCHFVSSLYLFPFHLF
jgi:hypothetical protein